MSRTVIRVIKGLDGLKQLRPRLVKLAKNLKIKKKGGKGKGRRSRSR